MFFYSNSKYLLRPALCDTNQIKFVSTSPPIAHYNYHCLIKICIRKTEKKLITLRHYPDTLYLAKQNLPKPVNYTISIDSSIDQRYCSHFSLSLNLAPFFLLGEKNALRKFDVYWLHFDTSQWIGLVYWFIVGGDRTRDGRHDSGKKN